MISAFDFSTKAVIDGTRAANIGMTITVDDMIIKLLYEGSNQ